MRGRDEHPARVPHLRAGLLDRVQPYDWTRFLHARLDTNDGAGLLRGLELSGWKLAWSEEPNSLTKGFETQRRTADFAYSLGFEVGRGDTLSSVRWGARHRRSVRATQPYAFG